MRIRVNPIDCHAHGLCGELFPEWIRLDEWGYPIIEPGDDPGRSRRSTRDAPPTPARRWRCCSSATDRPPRRGRAPAGSVSTADGGTRETFETRARRACARRATAGASLPGRGIVLLLHGGGQTRHSWARTGARLADAGYVAARARRRAATATAAGRPTATTRSTRFVGDLLAVVDTLAAAAGRSSAPRSAASPRCSRSASTRASRARSCWSTSSSHVEPAGVGRIRDFMTAHLDGFAIARGGRRRDRRLQPPPPAAAHRSTGCARTCACAPTAAGTGTGIPPSCASPTSRSDASTRQRLRDAASRDRDPDAARAGRRSDVVSDAGLADMRGADPARRGRRGRRRRPHGRRRRQRRLRRSPSRRSWRAGRRPARLSARRAGAAGGPASRGCMMQG